MRAVVIAVVLTACTAVARADPPAADLARKAKSLARSGRCDLVPSLAWQIRKLDSLYYRSFVAEPEIAACGPIPDDPTRHASYRSPDRAFALSALPVLGGIGLFAGGIEAYSDHVGLWAPMTFVGLGGILVGPTLGHVYAGTTWSNWLGLRLTGLTAMVIGGAIAIDRLQLGDSSSSCDCAIPAYVALGGAGLFVVTTFGEVLSAPSVADNYNHEHHLDVHVGITPITGTKTPGLALSGAF